MMKIGLTIKNHLVLMLLFLMFALTMIALQGCEKNKSFSKEEFQTEYQGILLANGTAYFGKIEKIGPQFVELKDVYYLHNQPNPDDKASNQSTVKIIKRGKEWHKPDRMYLNMNHIIMIEPIAPDSDLEKLIKNLKSRDEANK